jgi:hypothetical protein
MWGFYLYLYSFGDLGQGSIHGSFHVPINLGFLKYFLIINELQFNKYLTKNELRFNYELTKS